MGNESSTTMLYRDKKGRANNRTQSQQGQLMNQTQQKFGPNQNGSQLNQHMQQFLGGDWDANYSNFMMNISGLDMDDDQNFIIPAEMSMQNNYKRLASLNRGSHQNQNQKLTDLNLRNSMLLAREERQHGSLIREIYQGQQKMSSHHNYGRRENITQVIKDCFITR